MATQYTGMLNESIKLIQKFVPKYKVIEKRDSLFHKFIGVILFFNRLYMSKFTTTIGYTTALPTEDHNWTTIIHEGVHVIFSKRVGRIKASIMYMMPQALSVFAALSFLISPLFLFAIIFILPIPSYWRMKQELEAYRVTVILRQWVYGKVPSTVIDRIVKQFTGLNYYCMWPWSKNIREELEYSSISASIVSRAITDDPYLVSVLRMLIDTNQLHENAVFRKENLEKVMQ